VVLPGRVVQPVGCQGQDDHCPPHRLPASILLADSRRHYQHIQAPAGLCGDQFQRCNTSVRMWRGYDGTPGCGAPGSRLPGLHCSTFCRADRTGANVSAPIGQIALVKTTCVTNKEPSRRYPSRRVAVGAGNHLGSAATRCARSRTQ